MRKGLIFLSTLLTCYTLFSQSKCEDLVNFQRSEYAAFLIDTIYFCEPETQLGDSNSIVETLSRHNFPIDSSKSIQSDEALSSALNFIHDTFGVSLEDSFHTVIGGYYFLKNDLPEYYLARPKQWILFLEFHGENNEVVLSIIDSLKNHSNYITLVKFPVKDKWYDVYYKDNKIYLVVLGEHIHYCYNRKFRNLFYSYGLIPIGRRRPASVE